MQLDIVATWVLLGLMAGGLAGFLLKPGGYGLLGDLLLGLAGSLIGIGFPRLSRCPLRMDGSPWPSWHLPAPPACWSASGGGTRTPSCGAIRLPGRVTPPPRRRLIKKILG